MMHYLLHLLYKSMRQTLCIMPKGHDTNRGDSETIKDNNFYIINRQHNVDASTLMQNIGLKEDMVRGFEHGTA